MLAVKVLLRKLDLIELGEGRCAAAGLLLFQTCLNVFGATDVLPLTGVTLPFISLGGSSMMAVWGLLAFIKASDERTYAVRRKGK